MDRASAATTRSYLIRDRDAVVTYVDFRPVIQDLECHLVTNGLEYEPFVRQLLSDGLTALALHISSRPLDEHVSWTLNIQQPWRMNLFFTGSSRSENVVGRAFFSDVLERPRNLLVVWSVREFGRRQQSAIEFDGVDLFAMCETYYAQSEQKFVRFLHREHETAMLQPLPGGDSDWASRVDPEECFSLEHSPNVVRMAERYFRFHCGCEIGQVTERLVAAFQGKTDDLFGEEPRIDVSCERCGAGFVIARDEFVRAASRRAV
jgi:molecular chaperone Hsp33